MNNPFDSLLKRYLLSSHKKSDSIYCNKENNGVILNKQSKIIFDLSDDKFVHLGDALFFIPLIVYLSHRSQVTIYIQKSKFDFFLNLLKNTNVHIYHNLVELDKQYDLLVTVPYCILVPPLIKSPMLVGVGHSQFITDIPYPIYLASCFITYFFDINDIKEIENDYLRWKLNYINIIRSFETEITMPSLGNEKYFIVSPFIGSGKFRDLFNLQRKNILGYVEKYISIGYTPILVGSSNDILEVDGCWVDLRGRPLQSVAALTNNPKVKFGIGFDNFWMHYCELIGIKYLTKFRGRFVPKNREIHFSSVNKSFSNSAKWYIF